MRVVTVNTIRGQQAITLRGYIKAYKQAKADPDHWFRDIGGYGSEFVSEFVRGMEHRISLAIPRSAEWPEHPPELPCDKRGPEKRLLTWLRKHGRICGWCGSRFIPQCLADKCCEESCKRAHSGA